MPVVNRKNSVTDPSLWEGAKRGRKGKMLSLFFHCLLFNFLSPDRDPCRGFAVRFQIGKCSLCKFYQGIAGLYYELNH